MPAEPNGSWRPAIRRIFVNRNLRLDTAKAIGFDMDYTLARYTHGRLEELAHRLSIEKLIARGYPKSIQRFKYDPEFVIRGLSIDKQLGNIVKLDRHGHVARAFHGRKSLTKKERRTLYRREKVSFAPPRFAIIDTQFALPEMCLYADLVDLLGETVDNAKLFTDTRECIDEAHRDNTLKSIVKQDLAKYIERDELLEPTLQRWLGCGKKLFLLTNSFWDYTSIVMDYLLAPHNWRDYFEIVICGADKPNFFTGQAPFLRIDNTGKAIESVEELTTGGIYQGGNLAALEHGLGIFGEDILYIGDHIYGDILRTKKAGLWRTALIVEELEDEIQRTVENANDLQRLLQLENERQRLDDLLNDERATPSDRDKGKKKLKNILRQVLYLEKRIDAKFNAHWGMIFKEMPENSRFADQVEDYACVYTSRVSNFYYYSPLQYFRSPHDLLPHEYEIFK
jgi:5'-nucleotidase